jgi:hypothetical protein
MSIRRAEASPAHEGPGFLRFNRESLALLGGQALDTVSKRGFSKDPRVG